MATLQDQLDWEEHCKNEGLQVFRRQIFDAKEGNRITDTPMGNVVLRKYVLDFATAIAKDITDDLNSPGVAKQAVPLLFALDINSVALITMRQVLNTLFGSEENTVPLTRLARNLGKTLYAELALASFKDISPDLFEALVNDLNSRLSRDLDYRLTVFKMQAKENGIVLPEWSNRQRVLVGTYLINILSSPSFGLELLEVEKVQLKTKTPYIVKVTEKVNRVMEHVHVLLEDLSGRAAPTLIKPMPWSNKPNEGGFYGELRHKAVRFYKGPSKFMDIMQFYGADNNPTIEMLNVHQNVAWKVNPFIYDLARAMDKKGLSIKDSIEFSSAVRELEPERPPFLDKGAELTESEEAIFKEWKVKMRDWYIEMNRVGRAESRVRSVIKAATSLINRKEFYYVYQGDYRFRMYPVSGALNPQGSDIQKAMIHAAHGAPIDSEEALWWFKLSLAAKYGIDKLSPEQCVQWVDDNHTNIIKAAEDPLNRDAFAWWSDADKPMQFIAVCDEYRRYHLDPENFLNRIAVSMDGTCNGLQNYSAIFRDAIGGLATNLISSPDGLPNDIYKEVAQAAYKRLLKMPDSLHKRGWLEYIVDRKLTKKPVMTQVYGSTFGTCRDAVIEFVREKGLFEGQEYEFSDYAAHLVWDAIGDVVVKAAEGMEWLRKATSQIMKQQTNGINTVLAFPSPTGAVVVQDYRKYETQRITVNVGRSIQLRVAGLDMYKVDKLAHRNSAPPNFIHCVDSGHMCYTTLRMARLNIPNLFLHFIHDDYGTLAKYAGTLARELREAFIDMHSHYSIEDFGRYYKDLPTPPSRGDLDINCVRDSINFFR